MAKLASNSLRQVQGAIEEAQKQSARSSSKVTLICVSKYHEVSEAMALYEAGQRHFAENYVQGLEKKKAAMPDDVIWHLIGPLQSRKVKEVINDITYYHALSRQKIAKEINKRANHTVACFVQVNISGEASKSGLAPARVADFIDQLAAYPRIKVVGLMTMAPHGASEEECTEIFTQLSALRTQIAEKNLRHAPCTELSMGMSEDYLTAVHCGASFVRLGRRLFAEPKTAGSKEERK